MKKTVSLISAAAMLFTLCACGGETEDASPDKLRVYTSFYAMYDLTRQIAGDRAKVDLLCPVGEEPHDYEPKTSQIAAMSEAELFIYNGGGVDSWALELAPEDISVCASEGISYSENNDPHIWLDPSLALKEAENIAAALSEADPEGSEVYAENLGVFSEKISALISDYGGALSELPGRDIIVSHAAYGYLCSAFGLNQIAIEDSQAEEPSPARMARIIEEAKEKNIRYVCAEELKSDKVVNTAAREIGARTVTLNPFEGDKEGRDYFEVMYNNLEVLKVILE